MATVLVVDDDRAFQRLVRLVLRAERFEVLEACSGEEGLEVIQVGAALPDLILLDLAMPGMDGREFFFQARRAGYGGPVLFCSSFGATAANEELGGQGAVTKPFDPETLVASVRSLLAAGEMPAVRSPA